MLYLPSARRGASAACPNVTERKIAAVVEFWKAQGQAQYQRNSWRLRKKIASRRAAVRRLGRISAEDNDPLFNDAVRLVIEFGKASTSLLHAACGSDMGAQHISSTSWNGMESSAPHGPSRAKCSSGPIGSRKWKSRCGREPRFGCRRKHRPQVHRGARGKPGLNRSSPRATANGEHPS